MATSYRGELDKIAPRKLLACNGGGIRAIQHRSPRRAFREGLDGPGLNINPVRVQQMDSVDDPGEMQEVGKGLAKQKAKAEHFAGFLEAS